MAVKIVVAAIQMPSDPLDVPGNLQRADELLRTAHDAGRGAGRACPNSSTPATASVPTSGPTARRAEGPTITHLRRRSRQWRMAIAAGFVERDGRHLYDSLAFADPDGEVQIYRKRNLVFWERFRFHPGRSPLVVTTPWGRVGFAICADMIYRKVWNDYRDRIDLAVVSAAWPNFANRDSGRRHWLLGHVGPLSEIDPREGRHRPGNPRGLRQPVRRDPHDDPRALHPDQGSIRRPEQHLRRPAWCAGAGRRRTGPAGRTHHPPSLERSEIVAFYVPLGPRGVVLRIGTFLIGLLGGVVYRAASRRRRWPPPLRSP